jgi:ABC-type sulfate/molybdate transport systems ATPase subunit
MTRALNAEFEKRFRGGTVIRAALRHPLDEFRVTALVGPSGCGKTTILRCLAGLKTPEQGRIRFGNEVWHDGALGISVSPQERGIGYLFQEYALFPHLDVSANVAFGLRKVPDAQRRERVADLLAMLRLEGLERRFPHELSGGQQQRVALARTVAPRPRLLLLDEPLSALDTATRSELRQELRGVLQKLSLPTLIVTHDAEEVRAFADDVVVLDAGRVLQSGPVIDVIARPASPAVARIVSEK